MRLLKLEQNLSGVVQDKRDDRVKDLRDQVTYWIKSEAVGQCNRSAYEAWLVHLRYDVEKDGVRWFGWSGGRERRKH